jgi:hypothetical protein
MMMVKTLSDDDDDETEKKSQNRATDTGMSAKIASNL